MLRSTASRGAQGQHEDRVAPAGGFLAVVLVAKDPGVLGTFPLSISRGRFQISDAGTGFERGAAIRRNSL